MKNETAPLVIIGAGIAGLSTALAWTKVRNPETHPVLVLEKNPVPGGCVMTFARKGYHFDTVQMIPDCRDLLRFFDIDIPLKRFEGSYARLFTVDPETRNREIFDIPSSVQDFSRDLQSRFPEDRRAILNFFEVCEKFIRELNNLKTEPRLRDLPAILLQCPQIIRFSNSSYEEFLKHFGFRNRGLVRILDAFSSFSGLSGQRCAALLTACAMMTTLHGAWRPQRGFIDFPSAFMRKAVERGVRVRRNCEVDRILSEDGRTTGVQLKNGDIIPASNVVSTADTKNTLLSMLDHRPGGYRSRKYFQKAEAMKMSPSGFAIHIGLDGELDLKGLGFDCAYNILSSSPHAHETLFQAWDRKELLQSDEEFHLAVTCPSLQRGDRQNLIIHVVPVPSEYWIQLRNTDYRRYVREKQETAEFYISKVEEYMIPGLRKHILIRDISTPATYARYLGSPTGSQYDMLPVPENFGKNRLPSRTPVKNLYLTKFSHGIWPAMQAGLQIVDMITGGEIMKGRSTYREAVN